MDYVSGIGGAFIFSHDPKSLAQWYESNLGLAFEHFEGGETHYLAFYGLYPEDPTIKLDTNFAIMKSKRPLTSPATEPEPEDMYGDQPYMINFRVWDLDSVLSRMRDNGVAVIKREDEEYGKFAWVRDADGNRIELYEPVTPGAPA